MALDQNIYFRDTGGAGVPSLMDALNSGIQASQAIKQAPLMEAIRQQKMQNMQIEQQQQQRDITMQSATDETSARQFINKLATSMKTQTPEQRAFTIQENYDYIRRLGKDPATIDTSDQGLDRYIQATSVYSQQPQEGKKFIGTPQRITRDGQDYFVGLVQGKNGVELSETPVQGEFISSLGETAGDISKREAEDAKNKTLITTRTKEQEQARQVYLKQGRDAIPMLKNLDRLIEINSLIDTGKPAAAAKKFTDLFGSTGNIGEFNSRAGQLVLGSIRQLGANPTEGERAFLEQIMPSIQQGGKVNEALLNDLRKISKSQLDRAKWLAKNPEKSVDEYFIDNEAEDFSPTSKFDTPSNSVNGQDQLLIEAEAAIKAGAPRDAVMQRLQQLRGGQ